MYGYSIPNIHMPQYCKQFFYKTNNNPLLYGQNDIILWYSNI